MHEPMSRTEIETLYGIAFPNSLYEFSDFLDTVTAAIDDSLWNYFGIAPAGPLLLLRGVQKPGMPNPLWESRYYNDPPEFFTVLRGDTDGLHWGYYIDDPTTPTFPVAMYWHSDAYELSIDGRDLFDVFRYRIERYQHDVDEEFELEGIDEEERDEVTEQMALLRSLLPYYTLKERPEIGDDYLEAYPVEYERGAVVAETPEHMGIVVAPEQYRPLTRTNTTDPVEARVTEALQLLSEGYPGAALELGRELWLYDEFKDHCDTVLDAAYTALNRELLRKILRVARECQNYYDRQTTERQSRTTP